MEVLDAAAVGDVGDTSLDGGHPAIDDRHRIVGGLQLRTVDRIGAGIAQHAGGDVGDLLRTCAAMLGAERAYAGIPQQCIVGQAGNLVTDGDDAAFDIGYSAIDSGHRIVGGLQLAAVDRIRAGVAQHAGGDVGDLLKTCSAMLGTERADTGIPQQRIVGQAGNLVADGDDAAFDIGYSAVDGGHLVTQVGHAVIDSGHRIVGGLQLATVDCFRAGIAQLAGGDVGDLVRAINTMHGTERTGIDIPQQRITFQTHYPAVDVGDTTAKGGHTIIDVVDTTLDGGHTAIDASHRVIGSLQLATVDRIRAGIAQHAGGDVGDLVRTSAAMVGAERIGRGIPQQGVLL
ncbi:hypothetical protein D3C81_1123330 [compost metagenome]